MTNISSLYTQFQEWIAVTIGAILQLLFTPNLSYRLVIIIVVSSIATALYIVKPILHYVNIPSGDISASAYAISSIISVAIIRLIIRNLPKALQFKALDIMGIDYKLFDKGDDYADNK